MTVIEGAERIALAQMSARRWALHLEILGMTRHGRPKYVVCKEAYGLKGSRKSVLAQMDALIAKRKEEYGII